MVEVPVDWYHNRNIWIKGNNPRGIYQHFRQSEFELNVGWV